MSEWDYIIVGAGSAEGTLDAANILKPALSRGEIQCIGATTPSEFRKSIEAQTPLGRIGRPDDIAPVAVFLASDDSKWVTGETLYVSGGQR